MIDTNASQGLRALPLPGRLVLATFLCCVGVGYLAALVQLHVQHASPGNALPDSADTVRTYSGQAETSQLTRLLLTPEHLPMDGNGSMQAAFTFRSAGWRGKIRAKGKEAGVPKEKAERLLRDEREGERLALIAWIEGGLDRESFDEDSWPLPTELAQRPITEAFIAESESGARHLKVSTLVAVRCARCHTEGVGGASEAPLDEYEQLLDYAGSTADSAQARSGGMPLRKLAQSTHVHLLAFSMLYGLTGLIFALSSWPHWLRCILGPLPLITQVADISCWWFARVDPSFAYLIMVFGGLTALALLLQIILSLLDLVRGRERLLLAAALAVLMLLLLAVKLTVLDQALASRGAQSSNHGKHSH